MKPSAPIGVKFHAALLGNYDGQTDRPINRQADRPGHREVSLPIFIYIFSSHTLSLSFKEGLR